MYSCPTCKDRDSLNIAALVWVRLVQEEGSDDFEIDADAPDDSSHEWGSASKVHCVNCGWKGVVGDCEQGDQRNTEEAEGV